MRETHGLFSFIHSLNKHQVGISSDRAGRHRWQPARQPPWAERGAELKARGGAHRSSLEAEQGAEREQEAAGEAERLPITASQQAKQRPQRGSASC